MLNQVTLAGTVLQHVGDQFTGGVELVVTGKMTLVSCFLSLRWPMR